MRALVVAGVIARIEARAVGEGVPSYLDAVRSKTYRLPLAESALSPAAAFCTIASLGNGGVVGPLGMSVVGLMFHVGGALTRLRFDDYDRRTAMLCGLAAVIGIFFHSSIGGGVLAVEIIRRADM